MKRFVKKYILDLTSEQKDLLLGLIIVLVAATFYYFQWAYYLTGLKGSKVNIDQPEMYFWWANDSISYREAGEWLFERANNTAISTRPWLYPLLLGIARTLLHQNAEEALWFGQFLMWLVSGLFIYLALKNTTRSVFWALLGAGVFYSHPSPLILTFHGMTETLIFLLISIFCWRLTSKTQNYLLYALLLLVLATVVKPIYLVHVVLFIGYIFLQDRQFPWTKKAGKILLILLPIWIQLVLSFMTIGKLTISTIGSFTFKEYLVADVYMSTEGTEWRETTKLIKDWTLPDQLNYLWHQKRITALTYRAHLIDENLWTGSFFTLGEGNRMKEFAITFNAVASYLHVIMLPLVIYYLFSLRNFPHKEIIWILYAGFVIQFLTSGISTGQEDRLLITALPLWIITYTLVLIGLRVSQAEPVIS